MKRSTLFTLGFASFVLGVFLYSVSANYYLAHSLSEKMGVIGTYQRLVISKLFVYGVVQSADTEHRTVTVRWQSVYSSAPLSATIRITDDTIIGNETLLTDQNGTYTGVSPVTPGTFSDLTPGTRVAVSFRKNGDALDAKFILFGNPF